MSHGSRTVSGVVAAVLVVTASLVFVATAHAWNVQALNGANLYITREASDTATETVTLYRYAGSPTAGQWSNGSYVSTQSGGFFYTVSPSINALVAPNVTSISYPLLGTYAYMVYFPSSGRKWFIGQAAAVPIYQASITSVAQTQTTVNVSSLPSVTVDRLVSVGDTMPVSVEAVGSLDRDAVSVAGGLAVFALGLVLARATRRGWSV